MNDHLIAKLDEHINDLLEGRGPELENDPQLRELMWIASEMSFLPRPGLRARLQADLELSMERRASAPISAAKARSYAASNRTVIPPLFASGSLAFPMRGSRLAVSFGLHVIALALIGTSGWWMVENRQPVRM